ncbi:MAG: GspE/PulE family protein [Candidatus Peribacteraceae bacterium]|nr:GspE/PulE family protein [Candidatus Peribacteraceae bacterium]
MDTKFDTLDGETLLKALHEECTRRGVSDIHLSPEKRDVRLEWRLHGVLLPLARVSHQHYVELLRRIKFMAKLKMNVTNVPQDGQYTFQFQATAGTGTAGDIRTVNVRVATIPSRFGEAITLRLLDPARGIIPLEKLGFPGDIKQQLQKLVELPNGLILVTGPTGSGKTTTLYALLSTIIGKERNIITLEDPVEYELPGIIQSEIDPDHDYTFAGGLRSILRHDPDVILVGEIRDLETAQTAVNASLTGHVVLSTLHTNSAIEAVHRLLSMGVSPYTLAPSLRAILAQRLVRTLKEDCRAPGTACNADDNASYDGQMCLPELLVATPAIQQSILNFESTASILEQARKEGYKTMREWGKELVADKRTTQLEVDRVCM